MIDVQKVNETKEKIINVIRNVGPSFPTRISREAGISPLFIGALLSEMVAEKKLEISHMRVGSSPLYFIKGQETNLENFVQYLNSKEREAFTRLKESNILNDEDEDPAIRVALRKLKDFAIPLNVKNEDKESLFWKFFLCTDENAETLIEKRFSPQKKEKLQEKETADIVEEVKEVKPKKKAEKKEKKPSAFATNVKDYLSSKSIEILKDLPMKAKEYSAHIRIDTPIGKQEYLLIAKDKKKITEDDISLAVHKSQSEKMPALLLTQGEIDKTAKEYAEQWKSLVKIEKTKLA